MNSLLLFYDYFDVHASGAITLESNPPQLSSPLQNPSSMTAFIWPTICSQFRDLIPCPVLLATLHSHFPWPIAQTVKNLPGMRETCVRSLGLGRCPGGGHGNPLQYSSLENPHEQRSLAGYSPWDCKELDTTEQLTTHTKENTTFSHVKLPGS